MGHDMSIAIPICFFNPLLDLVACVFYLGLMVLYEIGLNCSFIVSFVIKNMLAILNEKELVRDRIILLFLGGIKKLA